MHVFPVVVIVIFCDLAFFNLFLTLPAKMQCQRHHCFQQQFVFEKGLIVILVVVVVLVPYDCNVVATSFCSC